MPDVYASIDTADDAVQERLAEVLELRAADAAQQAMLEDYPADLPLGDGARVLEVGCGTGAVARTVAVRPGVGEVVGLDPGYVLTLIDRGADTLVASGGLGDAAADALKAEARRRVTAGEFVGHIAYASLIATRR
jgi:SAM-dependent methyltransferase